MASMSAGSEFRAEYRYNALGQQAVRFLPGVAATNPDDPTSGCVDCDDPQAPQTEPDPAQSATLDLSLHSIFDPNGNRLAEYGLHPDTWGTACTDCDNGQPRNSGNGGTCVLSHIGGLPLLPAWKRAVVIRHAAFSAATPAMTRAIGNL